MSTRTPRKFVGGYRPDGLPHTHLEAYGIPARDLDGDELDALTADQMKIADDSGLYAMAKPAKSTKATAKPDVTIDDLVTPDADDAPIETHTPVTPEEKG